ncbi:MAG: hypothetical protein DRH51_01450 [Candidatus Coatesbacteria bacterium]|nr:MAG: hypothetical protein DRH51_01450 [Candidatus Coatesbacteria bacterium]RLC44404.1 MAG: hypothetical protein DRH44_02455 [Candidatus Coatesbacteria bacterium]
MRVVLQLILAMGVVLLLSLYGCTTRSGDVSRTDEENVEKEEVIYGEIIPPDDTLDEDIEELDETEFVVEGVIGEEDGGEAPVYEQPYSEGDTTETTYSYEGPFYRVQVIASSTKTGADKVAEEVRMKLPGKMVYVEHIGQYWKVRVGDCRTRKEAETLRDELRNLGYSDAWIVAP